MVNIEPTILAQYANSPTVLAFLQAMNEAIDPRITINTWIADVLNLATAEGYGLDLLGRIIGVTRTLQLPPLPGLYFGFVVPGTPWLPFGQEPFWPGFRNSNFITLDDDDYRSLLRARALSNLAGGDARSINAVLTALFSSQGEAYVGDPGGMQLNLIIFFPLTPTVQALLTLAGMIPRPAGVEAFLLQGLDTAGNFGFAGTGFQPFGQGTFFSGALYPLP